MFKFKEGQIAQTIHGQKIAPKVLPLLVTPGVVALVGRHPIHLAVPDQLQVVSGNTQWAAVIVRYGVIAWMVLLTRFLIVTFPQVRLTVLYPLSHVLFVGSDGAGFGGLGVLFPKRAGLGSPRVGGGTVPGGDLGGRGVLPRWGINGSFSAVATVRANGRSSTQRTVVWIGKDF